MVWWEKCVKSAVDCRCPLSTDYDTSAERAKHIYWRVHHTNGIVPALIMLNHHVPHEFFSIVMLNILFPTSANVTRKTYCVDVCAGCRHEATDPSMKKAPLNATTNGLHACDNVRSSVSISSRSLSVLRMGMLCIGSPHVHRIPCGLDI